MPDPNNSGSQNITADGAVGTSGASTRVYSIHIVSGGTAAIVSFYNNTSVTGTAFLKLTGTISTGATFTFGTYGAVFNSGCFVDVDANTVSVLVSYSQGN